MFPGTSGAMYALNPFMLLVALVLVVVPFWQIFTKAGYSGWLSLLMLVPLVNLITLWFLAFSSWPALEKRREGD